MLIRLYSHDGGGDRVLDGTELLARIGPRLRREYVDAKQEDANAHPAHVRQAQRALPKDNERGHEELCGENDSLFESY